MKKRFTAFLLLLCFCLCFFASCGRAKTISGILGDAYSRLREAENKKEILSVTLEGPEGKYCIDYPEVFEDLLEGLRTAKTDEGTKAPSQENGTAEILTFCLPGQEEYSLLFFDGDFCFEGMRYALSDNDDLSLAMQDIVRFGNEL